MDEYCSFFIVKAPMWFKSNDYNSLATWVAFYLEQALWI
jgi:hypothetical protein